jgi:2-keto-myo-inositol isomerase
LAVLPRAINHVTTPELGFDALVALACDLGCVGIELRNDLPAALFDGQDPTLAGQAARDAGLEILALAEVKSFNDWSDAKAEEADRLMAVAAACGARGVSLIPRNDGHGLGNGERQANLRIALRELKPMLDAHGLLGFVEPLGFEHCSMQYKSEAVEIIEALNADHCIQLVHDTFHHHLAGGGPVFPDHTGIVHVSGVTFAGIPAREMTDQHRLLVDGQDRLGSVHQVEALLASGYSGPISMEAFAPEVHAYNDPKTELLRSFSFIETRLAEEAA